VLAFPFVIVWKFVRSPVCLTGLQALVDALGSRVLTARTAADLKEGFAAWQGDCRRVAERQHMPPPLLALFNVRAPPAPLSRALACALRYPLTGPRPHRSSWAAATRCSGT
jgi:hypothetical protein